MNIDDVVGDLLQIAKDIGHGKIPPYQHNECYTSGAFDLILFNQSDTGRNYDIICKICCKYDEIKADPEYLKGYLYLLGQLAHSTKTTELPKGMMRIIDENRNDSNELIKWYRLERD